MPKTSRSRRTVILPTFLQRYLSAQQQRQAERRLAAGGNWQEFDSLVDRGDGSPLNPDTIRAACLGGAANNNSRGTRTALRASVDTRTDRPHSRWRRI